jgi:glucan endo-1,3-alpha-glucosidase
MPYRSDAFALNLGPEQWQIDQARSAYRICAARHPKHETNQAQTLRLFLSLDMSVLPSTTRDDMLKLVELVQEFGDMDCQLTVNRPHASIEIWKEDDAERTDKIVLSTFGGGEASFGGEGWHGFLQECKSRDLNVRSRHLVSESRIV